MRLDSLNNTYNITPKKAELKTLARLSMAKKAESEILVDARSTAGDRVTLSAEALALYQLYVLERNQQKYAQEFAMQFNEDGSFPTEQLFSETKSISDSVNEGLRNLLQQIGLGKQPLVVAFDSRNDVVPYIENDDPGKIQQINASLEPDTDLGINLRAVRSRVIALTEIGSEIFSGNTSPVSKHMRGFTMSNHEIDDGFYFFSPNAGEWCAYYNLNGKRFGI